MLLQQVYYMTFALLTVAIVYMILQARGVLAMSEGTEPMAHMAKRIRDGARVFEIEIYQKIAIAAAVIAVLLLLFVDKGASLAFVLGVILTTVAVFVGMSIATYANVRAAAIALENVNEEENVAGARTVGGTAKASQICGISVMTASLMGFTLIALIGGLDPSQEAEAMIKIEGLNFIAPVVRFTAYGLGWSIVAMFCRVAGGIFTKAADIGADLIGKVEFHFKEDDHRNPAVLADLLGDNANDIAGNQADLGESFTATPVTVVATAITMYGVGGDAAFMMAVAYPFIISIGGLISSIIGLYYTSHVKRSDDPAKQINASMYIAAAGALLTSFLASYFLFKNNAPAEFHVGWLSPFVSTLCGVVAGVGVGLIALHYTDLHSKWAKRISEVADRGAAIPLSYTQAAGWISCFTEIIVVMVMAYVAEKVSGPYGSPVMALGMLSFVAQSIGADAFGPISDNAGGIAESCELPEGVRRITDRNDAFGNSSAAMGKGFAIGSAAAVVRAQLSTYLMAYGATILDISRGEVMLGGFIGVGTMAMFCGFLAKFTLDAASEMAAECRKQLLYNSESPDAEACIRSATKYALGRMTIPVLIVVGQTIAIGFILGADALGGSMVGTMMIGLPLAIYFSNTGGLADNVKKRFETGLVECFGDDTERYDSAYIASIIGDTMGDWMKDVVAVSIDIFMKIQGTLGLMLAPAFANYHIVP